MILTEIFISMRLSDSIKFGLKKQYEITDRALGALHQGLVLLHV